MTMNEEVASDPGLAERDPYGAGWLIEAELRAKPPARRRRCLTEPAEITAWFTAKIAHYRLNGLIASDHRAVPSRTRRGAPGELP